MKNPLIFKIITRFVTHAAYCEYVVDSLTLKMEPIGCTETPVRYCLFPLFNSPENSSSQLRDLCGQMASDLCISTNCVVHTNNCPTRCNTKQSIYYSGSSLYMFRLSTTPIIRNTNKCDYSLQCCSYFLCSCLPRMWPSLAMLQGGSCTVPGAVVTVLCTPDDGCG